MKTWIHLVALVTVISGQSAAAAEEDRDSQRALLNSELRTAVQENRTVAALRLIRQGANVDCMDDWGLTPHAIQPLVAAGAEVNISNQYGQTPLILRADQGCGRVVEELLRVKRIRVEWKDDYGKTAFDYAKDADVIGLDGLGFDLLLARITPKKATDAKFIVKPANQPPLTTEPQKIP